MEAVLLARLLLGSTWSTSAHDDECIITLIAHVYIYIYIYLKNKTYIWASISI